MTHDSAPYVEIDKLRDIYRAFQKGDKGMPRPKVPNECYLLTVWRDVEPDIQGPFRTPAKRDQAARKYRAHHGGDDGIYGLDLIDGKPRVFSYSEGFFEDQER